MQVFRTLEARQMTLCETYMRHSYINQWFLQPNKHVIKNKHHIQSFSAIKQAIATKNKNVIENTKYIKFEFTFRHALCLKLLRH